MGKCGWEYLSGAFRRTLTSARVEGVAVKEGLVEAGGGGAVRDSWSCGDAVK